MIGWDITMDDNFTGVKNGTVYNNGKPVAEISSKYSTFSKQGSKKKESTSAEDIVKSKKNQNKK